MKVLVGRVFGLGNAVMSVPMLKAIKSLGHDIDILIGSTPDDVGSLEVFKYLKGNVIDHIYLDIRHEFIYDLAIMAIPFDGRWKNGIHYKAKEVWDKRTRPDPSTSGLISWKKHEVEYQMDNAIKLGYSGEIPDTSFLPLIRRIDHDDVYIGVGYKKDDNEFWKIKHWGNNNYIELIQKILNSQDDVRVISTGDILDYKFTLQPIKNAISDERFQVEIKNLCKSFIDLASCKNYIGNDTGFGHIASSLEMNVITINNLENSITKNHPWCNENKRIELDGSKKNVSVKQVYDAYMRFKR